MFFDVKKKMQIYDFFEIQADVNVFIFVFNFSLFVNA